MENEKIIIRILNGDLCILDEVEIKTHENTGNKYIDLDVFAMKVFVEELVREVNNRKKEEVK